MTDNSAIIAACHRAYTGFEANDPADLIALMTPDVVFDFPTSLRYSPSPTGGSPRPGSTPTPPRAATPSPA